jgi:phosphatidylserine decarboxylase
MMTIRQIFRKIFSQEDINFLLTNRIPRMALTHFMGWFSKIETPWIRDASIAIWRLFTDIDLSEAKKQTFNSLHELFVRELKPGSRSIDTDASAFVSPCDGIVGAMGRIVDGQVYQAKGYPYSLNELLGPEESVQTWQDGFFMTIRITSAMYHRFHAPYCGSIRHIRYYSGDTWNVNPIALKRVEKLFCKNERAFLDMQIEGGKYRIALVPVAAILVASIRIHGIDMVFHSRYTGAETIACDLNFEKGQELGWFEHGSTILVFVPKEFIFADDIHEGMPLQMGKTIFKIPAASHS